MGGGNKKRKHGVILPLIFFIVLIKLIWRERDSKHVEFVIENMFTIGNPSGRAGYLSRLI